MAYGDYSGPDKANKGHEGGACNRRRCQAEPAAFYNHGSHSWYCEDCARDIGEDVVNARHWPIDFPRLFPGRTLHPMFETREDMDLRKLRETPPTIDQKIQAIVEPFWPKRPGREKPQSASLSRLLRSAKRRA